MKYETVSLKVIQDQHKSVPGLIIEGEMVNTSVRHVEITTPEGTFRVSAPYSNVELTRPAPPKTVTRWLGEGTLFGQPYKTKQYEHDFEARNAIQEVLLAFPGASDSRAILNLVSVEVPVEE